MTRDECLQIVDEICTDMALPPDDSRGAAIRAAVAELSWGWNLNSSQSQLRDEIFTDANLVIAALNALGFTLTQAWLAIGER